MMKHELFMIQDLDMTFERPRQIHKEISQQHHFLDQVMLLLRFPQDLYHNMSKSFPQDFTTKASPTSSDIILIADAASSNDTKVALTG